MCLVESTDLIGIKNITLEKLHHFFPAVALFIKIKTLFSFYSRWKKNYIFFLRDDIEWKGVIWYFVIVNGTSKVGILIFNINKNDWKYEKLK